MGNGNCTSIVLGRLLDFWIRGELVADVEFQIHGSDDQVVAEELIPILRDLFEVEPRKISSEEKTRGDAWVIAGVILMVPPSVQSSVVLWNMAEGAERTKRLFEWAKTRLLGKTNINVVSQDGVVKDLASLDAESLKDLLSPPEDE